MKNVDLAPQRQIVITYPAAVYSHLVDGLAHRFGWREGDRLPATTDVHRRHATYQREERVLENGNKVITETWQPTAEEFAHDAAVSLIWQEADRGLIQKSDDEMKALRTRIEKEGLVSVTSGEVPAS
jgi:hypothetical protein